MYAAILNEAVLNHRCFLLALFAVAMLANRGQAAGITSAIVRSDRVEITFDSVPLAGASLVERRPFESVDAAVTEQAISINIGTDKTKIVLPRLTDGRDRLTSRWLLVDADQHAIGHEVWSRPTREAAKYPLLPVAKSTTKKGMGGIALAPELWQDLVDLGIGHVTLNVNLGQFFVPSDSSVATQNVVTHKYAGQSFRFQKGIVEAFERAMDFFAEHDIVVSMIILVPRADTTKEIGQVLVHPDCTDGHYSLPNLTTEESATYYAATLNFLAARFSSPTEKFSRGPAANWIIGNEVDAAWVWTNAGERTVDAYVEEFVRVLRVSDAAVRSVDPHARVFVSLTHHWTQPHQPNDLRFYSSRRILELVADDSQTRGDFPWGIAYHPYPQNLFDAKTWDDELAHDSIETPLITLKNLSVLDGFVESPAMMYQPISGQPEHRGVLLSEQGFHVPDDLRDGEAIQASALSYGWRAVVKSPHVEAFHYHRWIDHEHEGGLHLGLWTVEPGTVWRPGKKRIGWKVYQALDTDKEDDVTAPYLRNIDKR